MPHYVYRCLEGHEFEEWRSIHVDSMASACGCGAQAEKVLQVPQISPRATPSKKSAAPPKGSNTSWEKGTITDARGMPLLKANGDPVPVKEYAENRRAIEGKRRRLANDPTILQPTRGEAP